VRSDIQLLRGLAVSLVVAYHAGLGVPAGFLGVDIFFVVSGYLITRLVSRELDAGAFRFRDFYTRRAKRLLPAAYVTFALTTLAAMWLLNSREFIDFGKTLQGALTFTGNLALLAQTGYFDGAPESKPLLHTWSLAIEEQYYLGMPLLLWLVPKRARVPLLSAVVLASLAWCLVMRSRLPNEAFYCVEFRAWELGVGSLAAFVPAESRAVRWMFWPALLLVVVLPWVPLHAQHPGEDALALVLATAVVLVRCHPLFTTSGARRWLRPGAWLGDVSYSWYLLHWPPIALLHAVYLGAPPPGLKLLAAAVSLPVAALMYRFVEQPVRHHPFRFTMPRLSLMLAVSALLFATPLAWRRVARLEQRAVARADNDGLDIRCDFGDGYSPSPECDSGKDPAVLVWGDSLAMHLVSALAKVSPERIRQATKTSCGPLLGLAPVNDKRLTPRWAEGCQGFNRDVIAHLEQSPSIGAVVLGSSFERFVNPNLGRVLRSTGAGATLVTPSVELARAALRNTVAAITRLGKRVIVVSPPPTSTFDVGACLERITHGKPTLGPNATCQIADADRREHQRLVLELMAEVARWPDVKLVDLAVPLCNDGVCRTVQSGRPLYADEMHLTVEGSTLLAAEHGWASWTRVNGDSLVLR
jgi:peptidoglycan/LPS O-acetylase OafA/YrhL